jgi:hypothetical protein
VYAAFLIRVPLMHLPVSTIEENITLLHSKMASTQVLLPSGFVAVAIHFPISYNKWSGLDRSLQTGSWVGLGWVGTYTPQRGGNIVTFLPQ